MQKIKENIGNSIIFTDATIFINSNNTNELVDFFYKYLDNDLCFANNDGKDLANNDGTDHYNIGIILIKCNTKTLSFFENVLTDLTNNHGWDQDIINKHLLNNNNLKVNTFNKEKINCGWNFHPPYKNTFLIYKSFIHHDKNINKSFNKRLDIFKKGELITNEEYNANYKNE